MTAARLARLLAAPIAHRGLHACGSPGPVENSISAARAAVAAGYGIECDVQLSRDGEAMVFHDAGLERLTGVAGLVADFDAAALAGMPLIGGGDDTIPTLDAFLAAIAGRTPLVIEVKSDGDVVRLTEKVLAAIARYDGVAAVESFDPGVVLQCRAAGCLQPICLTGPFDDGVAPDPAALAASDFLSWDFADLEAAAALGRPLSTWTVRDEAQAARARRLSAQIVFEGFRPSTGRD